MVQRASSKCITIAAHLRILLQLSNSYEDLGRISTRTVLLSKRTHISLANHPLSQPKCTLDATHPYAILHSSSVCRIYILQGRAGTCLILTATFCKLLLLKGLWACAMPKTFGAPKMLCCRSARYYCLWAILKMCDVLWVRA